MLKTRALIAGMILAIAALGLNTPRRMHRQGRK